MTKNAEVTEFIEQIQIPWQVQIAEQLRQLVHDSIPDVQERVQYKKPHFLKTGSTLRSSRHPNRPYPSPSSMQPDSICPMGYSKARKSAKRSSSRKKIRRIMNGCRDC